MELYVFKTEKEVGAKGADIFEKILEDKPTAVLGLATGSTPVCIYQELVKRYEDGTVDFGKASSINLDEYVGLSPDDLQSYANFMRQHLFSRINIVPENCNIPDGLAESIEAECMRYDQVIERLGGVDIQLLGIGHDGHVGFNEPGNTFEKGTHQVRLTKETIEANARFFESVDQVPKLAITMGIKGIMNARKILLVAMGIDKADIVHRALYGPIDPKVPASILQLHPNLTVILDQEAATKTNLT